MRVGLPVVVEARVARAEVKAIAEGLQGGGAVFRHEVMVTKAMSVRLRAPEGGFFIETSSPETQWIENVLGLMADDFASWRWTVTPRTSGKKRLQLVISARTVGADGLAAETALPDQVIDVKVGINYAKTALRWSGWVAAAVAGGVLARFGEGLFEPVMAVVSGLVGG
jgi:neural Wiskott-Aldrich syndrome protein